MSKNLKTIVEPASQLSPLIEQRADPHVYRHTDGMYYFTASVPEYDRIELRGAATIGALRNATPLVIWRKHESGPMSANIWAPEIHHLQRKWYIYYAAAKDAGTHEGLFDHRIFVLENESMDPMQGNWVEKGQLRTRWETFCLDATVFSHKGTDYLIWAQKDPSIDGNSNLYICALENPWTLFGSPVMLSTPKFDWEIKGFKVNEGPACIEHEGRVFLTFSASATNHHYCIGLLYADSKSNLLCADSWVKLPQPILVTDASKGLYGPGHNSFLKSDTGGDLLVFHARTYQNIVGDPLYDPNRHTFIAEIMWDRDGFPCFKLSNQSKT